MTPPVTVLERAVPGPHGGGVAPPRAPRTLEATGLDAGFVDELLLKALVKRDDATLAGLAEQLALSPSLLLAQLVGLRTTQLVEMAGRGETEAEGRYRLTSLGTGRALEATRRCAYVGPAPVTLDDYAAVVAADASRPTRFDAVSVRRAFADLVVAPHLVDAAGAAMNSGRAMLLYGPAGSGKTFLARHLARLMNGDILVPHALYVAGEVIQVFDPLIHHAVPGAQEGGPFRADIDRRWVRCTRPIVEVGGELTLDMLDLRFDDTRRFYQAPAHLKANGGLFVLDDLGRQRVSTRELMNRWIVPLERREDYLTLHSGFRFVVPFAMTLAFSTNLRPRELGDEAFLRRFGYKLEVGAMDAASYRRVFESCCARLGVRFDADAFDWLIASRHRAERRPLLAGYPPDLVGRVRDFCTYRDEPPAMTRETLAQAWATYFPAPPIPWSDPQNPTPADDGSAEPEHDDA